MNKQIRFLLTLVLLLSFNEVIFAQDGNEELDSLIQLWWISRPPR